MADFVGGEDAHHMPVSLTLDVEDIVYEVKEDEGTPRSYPGADLLQENATKVWVPKDGDSEALWQLSTILTSSKDHNTTTVLIKDEESQALEAVTFSTDDIRWHDPSHDQDWSNVSEINDLNEPALLGLLKSRYSRDRTCTLAGETLLSVNPNKDVQTDADVREQEPSVENVAHNVYWALVQEGTSQAILINGESGAGKTEASKTILQWLMDKEGGNSHVHPLIAESNIVIEAFGNAKTAKNHNSSRFGKYTEVHYKRNESGELLMRGIATKQFLLEKSRVVHHKPEERNYHIFYQLHGASLGILDPKKAYTFLSPMDDETPTNQLECTRQALLALGFNKSLQEEIWKVLTAILLLGEIEFYSTDEDEDVSLIHESDATEEAIQHIMECLQVQRKKLVESLTTRTVVTGRRSCYTVPLSPEEARNSRNALAKALYAKLFAFVMGKVDEGLNAQNVEGSDVHVGVLDIFGFEVMETNGFEQFCVNYANEMLQSMFNEHVFSEEKNRYEAEGIDCQFLHFHNNQEILDVFHAPTSGVFSILDEQALLGDESDDTFVLHANRKNKDNASFTPNRFQGLSFTVRHSAGVVEYETKNFTKLNNDGLQHDLKELLLSTKSSFIENNLLQTIKEEDQEGFVTKKMANTTSVSLQFRNEMGALLEQLEQTKVKFIRCIKPNDKQLPSQWEEQLVMNQLQYLGVMECVRIRQQGFPEKQAFERFASHFAIILENEEANKLNPREQCEKILTTTLGEGSRGEAWQIGHRSMVFLSAEAVTNLEKAKVARTLPSSPANVLWEVEQYNAKLQNAQVCLSPRSVARTPKGLAFDHESLVKCQAWWRKCIAMRNYKRLQAVRCKWKQYLEPNEAVALMSNVIHTSEYKFLRQLLSNKAREIGFIEKLISKKKKRVLLLTTAPRPRLILIDPKSSTIKLELDVEKNRIDARRLSEKEFLLMGNDSFTDLCTELSLVEDSAGTVENSCGPLDKNNEALPTTNDPVQLHIIDVIGVAAPWVHAMKIIPTVCKLVTSALPLRLDSVEPILCKGYLKKRAIKSGKNWRERYFVLQGNSLIWYKSNKMGVPSGSFLLTSKSKLKFKTVSLEMVEEEQTHVKRSGMFGRAWSNDGDEYSEKHAFSVTAETRCYISCARVLRQEINGSG